MADAAIDHVGADAAGILQRVDAERVCVAVARRLPVAVEGSIYEADVIDNDAGRRVLAAAGAGFARQVTLPLISSGAIFGGLVLLLAPGHDLEPERMQIAVALADLCATSLGRADHVAKLVQANAELRASREVLARTEKLRALGQMAAGIQHDLRNVLNPLGMHVQIVERALAKNDAPTALASVQECKAVVRRGTEMLDRLRAFSRQSPSEAAHEVDLNTLAREAIAIARPRMSSRGGALSRVVEELGEVPTVIARGEEIVAALVNLVVNAIDAMAGGGTITVKTGRTDGEAWVSVADTGPGMTAEVQARIFEPFFTTKGAEGTGLGLAMVFATMQRHRGRVSLDTAPGHGATFTLSFPLPARA
ncbi:MAG TPA: ATP-binding protein [Polyangiaceae bacterium]